MNNIVHIPSSDNYKVTRLPNNQSLITNPDNQYSQISPRDVAREIIRKCPDIIIEEFKVEDKKVLMQERGNWFGYEKKYEVISFFTIKVRQKTFWEKVKRVSSIQTNVSGLWEWEIKF